MLCMARFRQILVWIISMQTIVSAEQEMEFGMGPKGLNIGMYVLFGYLEISICIVSLMPRVLFI